MTRSIRLLAAAFLGALAACSEQVNVDSTTPDRGNQRPNIIFLLADDQSAGTLSSAGHPVLRTPNLDRLAEAGTLFTNAFTVQPICAPSRFAILTGQYERTNGLGFSSPYNATEQQWTATYPALFRKAGYHTGFIGKFGVEFYTFKGRTQEKFDFWQAHDGWLSFFVQDNPAGTPIEAYDGTTQGIATEVMGESIQQFLRTAPSDKPFQLSVSFSAPHGSMTSSMFLDADTSDCETTQCRKMGIPANQNPRLAGHPIYGDLYRDADIAPPADLFKDPYHYLPENVVGHDKRKQWYDYLYDPVTNPEHSVRYYQQITGIDRVVGDLWDALSAQGLLENTIIIYSSDHGLITGEYGVGGKGLLYDRATKVPLIVVDPRKSKGQKSDALVLTIDLAPTMLGFAGINAPAQMQGANLAPLLSGRVEHWRDAILTESLTTVEDKTMSEALRTARWKYIRYFATPRCPYQEADLDFAARTPVYEQLFNLQSDPGERNNLAASNDYVQALDEMREMLAQQSSALSDYSQAFKNGMSLASRPPGEGCW